MKEILLLCLFLIMNYKFMRIMVMFDLPTTSSMLRREYTQFRRYLIKSGFLMLQESVYCKMASNSNTAELIINGIRKNKPSSGLVQVLKVTENQYSNMEYICGTKNKEILETEERIVFL